MKSSLTDQVRAACEAVSERASHVRIDIDHIPAYAASLPLEKIARPEHNPGCHYLGRGDDTVAFFLTLDVINFGSGYFPHLRKRPGMSGYFTVAASLNDRYRAHGPLSAEELANLTLETCTAIFHQHPDNQPIRELMQHFTIALNDLGRYLLDRFDGRFVALIEAAGASVERLVQLLVEMPYFNDRAIYGDLEVPFYKRAQIASADLSIAFNGRGYGRFTDLERLTIFADNLVPHVLRVDGILHYEKPLAARIDAGELIPSGSEGEIEIRACALHTVELLTEHLWDSGHTVTAKDLDYLLWNRQQPLYKARPRHRTRTVFY